MYYVVYHIKKLFTTPGSPSFPCPSSRIFQKRKRKPPLTQPPCLGAMSLAVDVPGFGCLSLPWGAGLTADDVIRLAQSRLCDPWHGNKLLSSGLQQLGCNEVITQQTAMRGVVLANYSEISAEDSHQFTAYV